MTTYLDLRNVQQYSATGVNYSTLTGSTIATNTITIGSTLTVSSLRASAAVTYSTLSGSTIAANTVTIGSTLTGSTIFASGNVTIGTTMTSGNVSIYSNTIPSVVMQNTTSGVFTAGIANGSGQLAGGAVAGDVIIRNDDSTKKLHLLSGTGNAVMTLTNSAVGIGTTTPNAQLQFSNDLGNRKLVLYASANNDHQYFGFGITAGMFRYQINSLGDSYAFYAGASASASNELMRIQGNGNVGIGTTNPTSNFQVGTALTTNLGGALYTAMNTVSITTTITAANGSSTGTNPYVFTCNANGAQIQYADMFVTGATYAVTFSASTASTGITLLIASFPNTTVSYYTTPTLTNTLTSYTFQIRANDTRLLLTIAGSVNGTVVTFTPFTATRLDVIGTGNVGIGTTAPTAQLHVFGSGSSGGSTGLRDNSLRVYGYQPGLYLDGSASGGNRGWNMWVGAAAGDGGGAGAFNLLDQNTSSFRFIINTSGTVRLPAYADGTMSFTGGNGTISSSSDLRLKENIVYQTNTSDALQKINQLKPATFNFIGGYGTYIGFIAQDVEQVIPLAVDGKKYEWVYEMDEKGLPKLDEQGQVIYKLDEQGQRIIRSRGLDNRAIIAVQTLAIQELAAQLSAKTQQLDSVTAWARTMGYSG